MRRFLILLTNVLLYFVLVLNVAALVAMPFTIDLWVNIFRDSYASSESYRMFILIFLYLAGIGTLLIDIDLIRMMKTLSGDPFVERNVKAFQRMGIVAELTAILFIVKCFIYFTPMTAVCAVVLVFCGLFSLVMTNVFEHAVAYKQENDLTI